MKKMLESESHHSATTSKLMDLGNDKKWLLKYQMKSEWGCLFSTFNFEIILKKFQTQKL